MSGRIGHACRAVEKLELCKLQREKRRILKKDTESSKYGFCVKKWVYGGIFDEKLEENVARDGYSRRDWSSCV